MCRNKFSSSICNDVPFERYMVNFKGGSFFLCSVYNMLERMNKNLNNVASEPETRTLRFDASLKESYYVLLNSILLK